MPTAGKTDLLHDLTPAQREAVTHIEGPLLVLAGPGSGKTRVITRRVAYLLQQGVRAHNILAITFTNKAAGEMRQRIDAIIPHSGVWISTFHSFGVRTLRQYAEQIGLERNFTIYDQSDRARMVKIALEDADVDPNRFTPDGIGGAISKAKNQLLSPEKYAQKATDFFAQTVARAYPAYEKRMREANAVDFDDLLYWPALALKHDPELRAELDARFRYVLIDEYQDTNLAQYTIARGLAHDYPNLCVVGDPDQSIYKFRGSDIKNILDFERDYPQARVLTLDVNYRSTKAILQVSDALIANNKQRKAKVMQTPNSAGAPVTVITCEQGTDEADQIVKRIREAVQAGTRHYRDFAIFLRMNALSRGLETAFVKQQVPFQIVRGLAFFDRKENRDVLAYLRLIVNPKDDLSFLRAVNEPARGVGKVSLEHLRAYAEPRSLTLVQAAREVQKIPEIKGKAAKALTSFANLLSTLTELGEGAPDAIIREVLVRSGYQQMLKESDDPEDQTRLENVEEFVTAAKQFTAEDSSRSLADFLENITLASDLDSWDEKQDCVSVMTLHASKGLEFPVVYMVALEQGLLPHERSLAYRDDIEEERRLAFVGMTRAKEELYLSHARLREFRGQTLYAVPSMFLDELPESALKTLDLSASAAGTRSALDNWRSGSPASKEGWDSAGVKSIPLTKAALVEAKTATGATPNDYRVGMIVEHGQHGKGKVLDVSGQGVLRKIKIRFSSGERTFLVDKAKLNIVKS